MEKVIDTRYRKFLVITYIASLVGFGGIMISNTRYDEIWENPLMIGLFLLGLLLPAVGSFCLVRDKFKEKGEIKKAPIILVLLLVHFSLYLLFKRAIIIPRPESKLITGLLIFLYSFSEFGWISLVYEYFEKKKGRGRSIIANGLFKTLYLLPLVLMPGFVVRPDFYAYLAGILMGVSAFSILIYEYTKNLYLSTIFTAIAMTIMYYFDLNTGGMFVVIGFVEVIIAYLLMRYLEI